MNGFRQVNELNGLIMKWFEEFQTESLLKLQLIQKNYPYDVGNSFKLNMLVLSFANSRNVSIVPSGVSGVSERYDICVPWCALEFQILRFQDNEGKNSWNIFDGKTNKLFKSLTKENLEELFERMFRNVYPK